MRQGQRDKRRAAFTLIELLVVISIIALLIGILLPALGSARKSAQTLVCTTTMRSIAQLQTMYAQSNEDFLSGANSNLLYLTTTANESLPNTLLFDTDSTTPTTTLDWLSPILGESGNFSANRAMRTTQLFNEWGCAGASVYVDSLYAGDGVPPDLNDFRRALRDRDFRQVSYLAPTSMYYWRHRDKRGYREEFVIGEGFVKKGTLKAWTLFPDDPAPVVEGYDAKLSRVGTVISSKVMFADGTRYAARAQGLDFDTYHDPDYFSSFYDSNPIDTASTAYSRSPASGHVKTPDNQLLSFRHPGDSMNIAYMDGHVGNISQIEAYTDPNPWWPSGSIWDGDGATQEARDFMNVQKGSRDRVKIY